MALSATVHECLHLTQWLKDFGYEYQFRCPLIYDDNRGAIALSKNPVDRQRSKHIDVRYHFIRTVVNSGRVVIEYCPTVHMLGDIMMKPVSRVKLHNDRDFLFG